MDFNITDYCKSLPKIELHAHLNGSLSDSTLELLQNLKNENTLPEELKERIENFKIVQGHSRTLSECFALFGIAQALTDTPEAVKLATKQTLEEFAEDNVIFIELRSTPRKNYNMTKVQYVQSMVDAVLECSEYLDLRTSILVSIDRRNTLQQAIDTVNVAIEMHKKYPDIVVGLDLSGDPKVGNFKDFTNILSKGRDAGLKIALHAAEVKNDAEVWEILQWAPDRLGHVTCIAEDNSESKTLWNALLESKIPIELCLTSNIKCGVVKSYSDHHFERLFKAGHPICLATDDKGVFTTSLSEEFRLCAETFNLTQDQIWELSFNAVNYIFADDDVKENIRQKMLKYTNRK